MSRLLALAVVLLPPPDVAEMAVALSAALPRPGGPRLRLDARHLPHITLTQQFIRLADLDDAAVRIKTALRGCPPIPLSITGGGRGSNAVWIAIAWTPVLVGLHRQLMDALRDLEQPGGGASAFMGQDARTGDVEWVTTYRAKAAFDAYLPHITLGYADRPPAIEPLAFVARTVAACHLGRFCTCGRVLNQWSVEG